MTSVHLDQHTQYDITSKVFSLQQQLDLTQHENQQLKQNISDQNEQRRVDQDYLELKMKSIIQENDSLYATQERLESDLYTKEQELDAILKEAQYWKRLHKELNKSLETERQEFDGDRLSWCERESQLVDTIRLLQQQQKDQQQQYHHSQLLSKQRRSLLSTKSEPYISPPLESIDCAAGNQCQQTVLKLNSTRGLQPGDHAGAELSPISEPLEPEIQHTIKAQADIITSLKVELEQQAVKLQQQHVLENQNVSTQLKKLMVEVDNIKQLNQSLMEENESYQMLLHEKTISGGFISDSIMQLGQHCQDNYFEPSMNHEYTSQDSGDNSTETHIKSNERRTLNLADELALASFRQTNSTQNSVSSSEKELLSEIKTLQDANRALQLYMNKILLRIVENKHLENILSIDKPNKGNKTPTTIINSSTPPPHLQTSQAPLDDQHQYTNLKQVNSRHSFGSIEDEGMSISSSDASSTKTTKVSNNGKDSWTQVFRRMSSGFTGWTRSNDAEPKFPLDNSSELQVDHVVRTLYFLNK